MTIIATNCPKCGHGDSRPVNFTWWGGLIGPRLFHLVKCTACGTQYNGKTGKSANTAILIYLLVLGGVAFACVATCTVLFILAQVAPSVSTAVSKSQFVAETRVPTSALPKQPTVVATEESPGSNVLGDAIAKTRAATAYQAQEDLSGSSAILPNLTQGTSDQITLLHFEAEYNGSDYHIRFRGMLAGFFGADETKGFEITSVAGNKYVFGPAPLLGAPDNHWYTLDSSMQLESMNPFDTLDKIADSSAFWAKFKKTGSGDSLDGKKCDLYSAGRDAASDLFSALVGDMFKPNEAKVVDTGFVNLYICDDGYLHNLVGSFTVHDQADSTKKGTAKFGLDLFRFDEDISITAPLAPIDPKDATPTVPAVPTAVPTRGTNSPGSYDGHWEGRTSDEMPISFDVSNNQVTFVNLAYAVQTGGCSVGGSMSNSAGNATINNKGFSVQVKDSEGRQFLFTGTFTSNAQASGTLQVKGTTSCGDIDIKSNWSATSGSVQAPATRPPATLVVRATVAPTAARTDVGAIITNLFDELNAKNVDAAIAIIGDDAIVNWGNKTGIMDMSELKAYLSTQVNAGFTWQVSNIQVVGNTIVNFSVKENGAGSATYSKCSAIINGGKISILTIK